MDTKTLLFVLAAGVLVGLLAGLVFDDYGIYVSCESNGTVQIGKWHLICDHKNG